MPSLTAALCFLVVNPATAQVLKTVYSFSASPGADDFNDDGEEPNGLFLSGNILYGTTYLGASFGRGTIFAVHTDGTGFTNLHNFTDPSPSTYGGPPYTNSDGADPIAGVILSGSTLYGTTQIGGGASYGVVFSISTCGTDFTNLHNFTYGDGADPLYGGLMLLSNFLYGTTSTGADNGAGTVFAVNIYGSDFTNLFDFNDNDGGGLYGGLIAIGNTLFGTTEGGGSNGFGTVFSVKTDGSCFSNLYNFSLISKQTNSDGAEPQSSLVISGGILYGTTFEGGVGGNGTIFAIHTDGSGFTNLHNFAPPPGNAFRTTNSDGANPTAALLLLGKTLYGTTTVGGTAGEGTLFAIHTDGSGFTNLHTFTGGIDGRQPRGALVASGNILYGTTTGGGAFSYGAIFSLTLPAPQIVITASGANVVLAWPTNVAGFDYTGYTLQSTTNLASPSWSTVSPPPVIVNGQETVTNPISATQMFYRLEE